MKKAQLADQARKLLWQNHFGTLATLSEEGAPLATLVRYFPSPEGKLWFCLSRIAEHCKNLHQNNRVSLLVVDSSPANAQPAISIQESARLSIQGRLIQAQPDEATQAQGYRYFPDIQQYIEQLDFDFYQLEPEQARYIGGFAKAHWLERAELLCDNPLSAAEQLRVIEHMNQDHADAVVHYCQLKGWPVSQEQAPEMVAITAAGFAIRTASSIYWFEFDERVHTVADARQRLVDLVQR